jgi:hypothetical protein
LGIGQSVGARPFSKVPSALNKRPASLDTEGGPTFLHRTPPPLRATKSVLGCQVTHTKENISCRVHPARPLPMCGCRPTCQPKLLTRSSVKLKTRGSALGLHPAPVLALLRREDEQ